jgi:gas vesicle protein
MRKTLSFLAGIFCGALVGGVTALLLAPYSGSEFQEQIRGQAEGLFEKGRQAAIAKRAELEAQLDAFKQGGPVLLQESSAPPEK